MIDDSLLVSAEVLGSGEHAAVVQGEGWTRLRFHRGREGLGPGLGVRSETIEIDELSPVAQISVEYNSQQNC